MARRSAKLQVRAVNFVYYTLAACLTILPATVSRSQAAATDFPTFNAIRANVSFWEKIYTQYKTTEAVIHDTEDLSKIYEVLPLFPDSMPGAARLNNTVHKNGIEKYRNILRKLAKTPPRTKDEKRVAAMFAGANSRQRMANAAENVRSQTGLKERFHAGVLNSSTYLREIKRIFRAHRLPEELAYIPHVESSFNTKAYSKYGAAGIWQFTRATGIQYLSIDYVIDERLDPIAASQAAAKYLGKSYRVLHDWPLAITSYNYGLAGAKRAQNEHGSYEAVFTHYNKGYFKFASKNFYPEFLAALKMAQKIEKQKGFVLTQSSPHYYYRLPDYAPLSGLASYLHINPEQIMDLNPALLPPISQGEKHIPKGYNLRLPGTPGMDQKVASAPRNLFDANQRISRYHYVKKGETAGGIAKKYGISLKALKNANNLNDSGTISIGQKLRIPGLSDKNKTASIEPESNKLDTLPILFAYKKARPSDQTTALLPQKDPTDYNVFNRTQKNGVNYGTIIAQPEESLELYAKWLKEPAQALSSLNNLEARAKLTPGQKLDLVFKTVSPNRFEDLRLDYLQDTEENFFSAFAVIGQQTYKVSRGDTLWNLCYNKFDIPLWLLERYNSSINLLNLKVSQELVIPIIQSI